MAKVKLKFWSVCMGLVHLLTENEKVGTQIRNYTPWEHPPTLKILPTLVYKNPNIFLRGNLIRYLQKQLETTPLKGGVKSTRVQVHNLSSFARQRAL